MTDIVFCGHNLLGMNAKQLLLPENNSFHDCIKAKELPTSDVPV